MSEMWDRRYAGDAYLYGTAPNAFLASVADRIPTGPVLCLAEGEGRNAVHLARRGHPVTAVDASAVGLAKAARLARDAAVDIELVHGDLAAYRIEPAAWSGIVAIFAHLPPALRVRVHADALAGLQPGGAFVLEAYTPAQIGRGTGGPPTAELTMTLAALRRELAGLEFEIARETEREVVEGSGHTGRAAVVQVLGVRPPDTDRASPSSASEPASQ